MSAYAQTDEKTNKQECGDENKERGNWNSPVEFVLTALGAAVGLGNVWRFPYLCYRNGGGAFLVPYTIMLFVAGLPLFFLEFGFGQYCSQGIYTAWKALPLFKGTGFGQMVIQLYSIISYNVVIMYCFYYFFASFTRVLPWIGCNHKWNTGLCSGLVDDCLKIGGIMTFNNTCEPLANLTTSQLEEYNVTTTSDGFNLSSYQDPFQEARVYPSEEYWKHQVLKESDSMNETGGLDWRLALCLILAWIVVFLCMIKGIKSIGKVVYFTAVFPYVVLSILLIRGLTLPGALDGIKFFIIPRWEYLANTGVWVDAAVQIFYSLGVAGGTLITMASYNKFHNNCYRDALIVSFSNCLTSIFAGFVIFSTVGFMAHEAGKPVDKVVSQGFGLAFTVYPEAVARMPAGQLWSALFFLMLITLGLDSQFVSVEVITTAAADMFPRQLNKRKTLLTLVLCVISLLGGFTCVTRAGGYWMSLIDQYSVNFHRLVFAFAEAAGLCWIYGIKRFKNDIRAMIGDKWVDHKTFWYWVASWCVITPVGMIVLILATIFNWKDPEYNGPYPTWAVGIGWMIMLSSLIVIPLDWARIIIKSPGSCLQRLVVLVKPEPDWGPALQEHRYMAAAVHRQHGTTMGGIVDLDSEKNGNTMDLTKDRIYSKLGQVDNGDTNV